MAAADACPERRALPQRLAAAPVGVTRPEAGRAQRSARIDEFGTGRLIGRDEPE